MKKFILTLACIFCMTSVANAATDALGTKIDQIEKSYFGYTYPKENNATRLNRLEKAIYGQISKETTNQRVQKLFVDVQADVVASAGEKTADASTGGASSMNSPQEEELPQAEKDVKYPVVDKIEQKVFNKTFTNEDVYKRLSRLEKQVFKKESKGTLSERVDNLRLSTIGTEPLVTPSDDETVVYVPKKGRDIHYTEDGSGQWQNVGSGDMDNDNGQYNYYSPQNTKNRVARGDSAYQSSSSDPLTYDIESMERNVLGQKFSGESASNRIARLEKKVFQRTFTDDEDARIQRLMAATTAQQTSKTYDNNKFMQRFAAGMQVGGIILMILAMIL